MPELIVFLLLVGIVLAACFAGLQVALAGHAMSDRQAIFAREIGAPLGEMEKILTQNLLIETAGPYSVTVLVDKPRRVGGELEFDHLERHVISATVNGTIVQRVYSTDAYRNSLAMLREYVWSRHNANVTRARPLFSFLGASGASLTTTFAPSEVRGVNVSVSARVDGRDYEGARTVHFRNR